MCACKPDSTKSTKILIIEEAFNFFKHPYFKDFSMSELAAKVGISKPAIYKHYKSKDAVLEAMESFFFDLVGSRVSSIQTAKFKSNNTETVRKLFSEFIVFFTEHTKYINYFIYQFSGQNNFDEKVRQQIQNHGIHNHLFSLHGTSDPLKSYSHLVYGSATILFFIKIRERTIAEMKLKSAELSKSDFAEKLISFAYGGLKNCTKPGDDLYPCELSPERAAKLKKMCSIKPESLPAEHKVFRALASVIVKYGINGVTLDHIAEELNMAKSSLYSYFDNKNQMLKKLLEKEIALMETFIRECVAEARNYSEYLYVTIHGVLSYFYAHKSILPICGWLLQTATPEDEKKPDCDASNVWESKLGPMVKQIDLGFVIIPKVLTVWVSILPVAISLFVNKYNLEQKDAFSIADHIFEFIQNGICNEETIGGR